MQLRLTYFLVVVLLCWRSASAQQFETSPYNLYPAKSDKVFVVEDGPDLDECVTNVGDPNNFGWPIGRPNGELRIEVPMDRYVGEVDDEGFLLDPAKLVANGLISEKAKVRIAARRPVLNTVSRQSFVFYDPQYTAPSSFTREIQESPVYLHRRTGREVSVGMLTGATVNTQQNIDKRVWEIHEFLVDISNLKFPSIAEYPGVSGPELIPANNVFSVAVDAKNYGAPYYGWCMTVDWISVSIDAIAPIVLVHGTAATGDSWEKPAGDSVVEYLQQEGVVFSNNINLVPNGSVDSNASLLKAKIRNIAEQFGVNSIHLGAHSKGGVDSRRFLSTYYTPQVDKDPEVESLTTLATPHDGTAIADLIFLIQNNVSAKTLDPNVKPYLTSYGNRAAGVLAGGARAIGKLACCDAVRDLQTAYMGVFNQFNFLPPGVKMYTIGADADLDRGGTITLDESTLFPDYSAFANINIIYPTPLEVAVASYNLLQGQAKYVVNRKTDNVTHRGIVSSALTYDYVSAVTTGQNLLNDFVLTVDSAMHSEGTVLPIDGRAYDLADHGSVKSKDTAKVFLENLTSEFPVQSVGQ